MQFTVKAFSVYSTRVKIQAYSGPGPTARTQAYLGRAPAGPKDI
jgi:hypothetical protein